MFKFYKFLIWGAIIILAFFANYYKKADSKITTTSKSFIQSQSINFSRLPSQQKLLTLADNPPVVPVFFEEGLMEQNNETTFRSGNLSAKYLLIDKSIQEISDYIFQELLLKEKNKNLTKEEAKELILINQKISFLSDFRNNKIELEKFDFEGPNIEAQAALIADFHSGQVYWAAGREKRLPVASLTKLMAAAVVMKNMNLNDSIEIKNETNSKNHLFLPGNRFLIKDIIKIMLLNSDNDAAKILAQNYGEENFVIEMNNLAKDWGLRNTFFDDPTGISAANQSTAEDIKKMIIQINNSYPEILKITAQAKEKVIELNSKKRHNILSINQFSGQSNFLGGKTGYTDEAGGSLVSVFNYKNQPIIFVVLGTKNYETRFEETRKLFEWFKNNF